MLIKNKHVEMRLSVVCDTIKDIQIVVGRPIFFSINNVPHWMVCIQWIGGFLYWLSGAYQATEVDVPTEWC